MKKQLISALILSIVSAGCQQEPEPENTSPSLALNTLEQKVSYVIGFNTAQQIKEEGYRLDPEIVKEAIMHLETGAEPLMTREEMHATMSTFQTELQERRQQLLAEQSEKNLLEGQAFLVKNAARESVVTTHTGLQYEVLTQGDGVSPKHVDRVYVNYKGMFIDGNVFDEGENVDFIVNQVIAGWVEGLQLMSKGAKWKLFIPADLAYASGGSGNIGPNSTLVFEIELLDIEFTPE